MNTKLTNQIKTVLLLGSLSAILVGVGALLAPGHLFLFAALAAAFNLGAYFFSDRLVLRLHRARELSPAEAPGLHAVVREIAGRAEIPMPRVYLVPDEQPNAFATGRNPAHGAVAVTDGILRLLDPRELRGVLAHEIGHIKNRDVLIATLAAIGASAITTAAHALSFGALFGSRDSEQDDGDGAGAGGLAVALVAPLAATLLQLGVSRSREYLADESGARLSGDPEALATALLKLEQAAHVIPSSAPRPATASLFIINPLAAMETLARWFSTHPSTGDRVARLRALAAVTPPQRPRERGWRAGLA